MQMQNRYSHGCRQRYRLTVERDRECGWQDRENVEGERVTVERERERECIWKLIERQRQCRMRESEYMETHRP